MDMKDFKELKVWQKAHKTVLNIYNHTSGFPKDEIYGLTSQMRRAVVSIASNIAEGCGRSGDAELARFFQIAMGSASELEYHILLSRDLNFLDEEKYEELTNDVAEIKRMLASFISKLKADR
jgi:four helix bundle protein